MIETVVGVISTLSATLLGWFIYKRSARVDKISEQSGIASDNREGIAQMITVLQADNQTLRVELKDAKSEIKTMAQECKDEIASINKRLNSFIRKYGENGS